MNNLSEKEKRTLIFIDVMSILVVAFNINWMNKRDYSFLTTMFRMLGFVIFWYLAKYGDKNDLKRPSYVLYFCVILLLVASVNDAFMIVGIFADILCNLFSLIGKVLFFWV